MAATKTIKKPTKSPFKTPVCLGRVTGAHGVRGVLRIRSFTQNPEDIAAYGPLRDQHNRHHGVLGVLSVTGCDQQIILGRLENVRTRQEALSLKGARLFVDRAALPPSGDEDSYYHADLIGLRALAHDGTTLGVVKAVYNFGAGDILEIRLTDGRTADLPFTCKAVPVIDPGNGFIRISPPPGLWSDRDSDLEKSDCENEKLSRL